VTDDDRGEPIDEGEYICSISPDVIRVLMGRRFFELLDDRLCPVLKEAGREKCKSDFAASEIVLDSLGFTEDDKEDIFAVLKSRGARCDCEILYNVVEKSRLKSEHWKAHAARGE